MHLPRFPLASALLLAGLALPAAAAAQTETITVTAPGTMTEDQADDWRKLDKKHDRLVERIAKSDRNAAKAQTDLAKARERIADAQDKLRRAERDLEKANERVADQREELAEVQARMVEMGGARRAMAVTAR